MNLNLLSIEIFYIFIAPIDKLIGRSNTKYDEADIKIAESYQMTIYNLSVKGYENNTNEWC